MLDLGLLLRAARRPSSMPPVHTHYENLKVARDASPDDIRAAYRSLTRRHHPDRNPDNADSERVMAVINVAYGVLSDPVKRAEHDRWIRSTEAPAPRQPARPVRGKPTVHVPTERYRTPRSGSEQAAAQHRKQARLDRRVRRAAVHVVRHRVAYGLAGVMALSLAGAGFASLLRPAMPSPTASDPALPAATVAGYVRSPQAPNGRRWPTGSGYVEGYPQSNTGGLSEVTIDNSQNDVDMFAKLVSLDGPSAVPVRTFFVAARGRFALGGLRIGTYDLRYRNLASGSLLRSPAFILEEVATERGTQHSKPTMKLYSSGDGTLQTYSLGDADF